MAIVLAENKAKHLSLVNQTIKTIHHYYQHHYHHYHHHHQRGFSNLDQENFILEHFSINCNEALKIDKDDVDYSTEDSINKIYFLLDNYAPYCIPTKTWVDFFLKETFMEDGWINCFSETYWGLFYIRELMIRSCQLEFHKCIFR